MKLRSILLGPAALSALLALALYAVCIGGTYIYDDVAILQMDKRLPDPHQWNRFWTESYNDSVDNLYRPLVSMSYAVEFYLHGDRPWIAHLINILLHAAICATLAEWVRRVAGALPAYVSGALFAAHPLHVEAVANIVGRAELMCALAMLGGLLILTRPLTQARALAVAGCFVVAVLSKETGMLAPLLFALFVAVRWLSDRNSKLGERKGMMLAVLLLCWGLGGYIVWREHILKFWWDRQFLDWTDNPMVVSAMNPHPGSVGLDRVLMPLVLLGHYTALLFAPVKLSIDYGSRIIGWHVSLNDPYLYLGSAAVLAWCFALLLAWRSRNWLFVFCCLALAITYGVIGNIVSLIGTNFGERLMYLPSAFFLVIVAIVVNRLLRPRALIVGASVLVIAASIRTLTYAAQWNDKLHFYESQYAQNPGSARLILLLASEYSQRMRFDDALRIADHGIAVLPEYQEMWYLHGLAEMKLNRYDVSRTDFEHAMEIHPSPKGQGYVDMLAKAKPSTSESH